MPLSQFEASTQHMVIAQGHADSQRVGSICHGYVYGQGEERLESSPVERDLGVLADGKLELIQQSAVADERANCTLAQHCQLVKERLFHSILHCVASPRTLGVGLDATIHGHKNIRERPKVARGLDGKMCEEWLKFLSSFSLEEPLNI